MKEPLGVIGAGWVGLVTAACFADLGHEVVVRDVVPERIAELEAGRVPIFEPGLSELLAANRERIRYTLDIADVFDAARIAFVSVPTPPTHSGDADLSAVWRVLDELPELERARRSRHEEHGSRRHRREGAARARRARASRTSATSRTRSSWPRARRFDDFTSPDRIVVGAFDEADGDAVAALYEFVDAPVVRDGRRLGGDGQARVERVPRDEDLLHQRDRQRLRGDGRRRLARRRGDGPRPPASARIFLRPGIGYSGSCLPKDVTALKQLAGNSGYHFQLLTAVIEVNELQKRRVVGKLAKHLGSLRGKTIALLGLAFKPNTNDMRDAPSLILAPRLLAEGAVVRGWDPVALEEAQASAPRRRAHGDAARGADGCGRSA